MDAREREESEPHRTSIKRPWEGDIALSEQGNVYHSALLPAIDVVPYRRPLIRRGVEPGAIGGNGYGADSRELVTKKAKFEAYDHNTFPRQTFDLNAKISPSQAPNLTYGQNRGSLEPPPFSAKQIASAAPGGPADSQDTANLCWKCQKEAVQNPELHILGDPDTCEDCKTDPGLAWVTQEAATWLTHLADTLRSGTTSEQRGISRDNEYCTGTPGCPPIAEVGLRPVLNWLLGRIYLVNQVADQFVRQIPAGTLQILDKDFYRYSSENQGGPADIMQRRNDVDSDDAFRSKDTVVDSSSDATLQTSRTSVATSILANEELLPVRSQPDHHPTPDGVRQRISGMNPPPVPHRQLPSPPGRSFPSPTTLTFPSPSTPSYGATQGINLPPPSSLHQSTSSNYLPPITAPQSSDSALRDHSAALQHEVSVQKIALSSLQSEHDKLLAAFSRSQTRASALEKKHAVSDSEIISLTEEKLRLQAQVLELEREVEDISRSRDDFRKAAVQEGSQYVEIVKMASRLEEMAGEERKAWNKMKEEMERKIEALRAERSSRKDGTCSAPDVTLVPRLVEDVDTDTPTSSEDFLPELKIEPTSEPRPTGPTSHPAHAREDSADGLREEIRCLQGRCAEVEDALRAIRDNSRSMEGIVKAALERADSTLQD